MRLYRRRERIARDREPVEPDAVRLSPGPGAAGEVPAGEHCSYRSGNRLG